MFSFMQNIHIHAPSNVAPESIELAKRNIELLFDRLPKYMRLLLQHIGGEIYLNEQGDNDTRSHFNVNAEYNTPFNIRLSLEQFSSFEFNELDPSQAQRWAASTLKEECFHALQPPYRREGMNKFAQDFYDAIYRDLNIENKLRNKLEIGDRHLTRQPDDGEFVRTKTFLKDYRKKAFTGGKRDKADAMGGWKGWLYHQLLNSLDPTGEEHAEIMSEASVEFSRLRDFIVEGKELKGKPSFEWLDKFKLEGDVDDIMEKAFPHSYKLFKQYEALLEEKAEMVEREGIQPVDIASPTDASWLQRIWKRQQSVARGQ